MRKVLPIALIALSCASLTLASDIKYVFTSATDTLSFTISQQPTPEACQLAGYASSCFSVLPTAVTLNGTTTANDIVSFYTLSAAGGLTVQDAAKTLLFNIDGPKGNPVLFTGTLADPTLEAFTTTRLTSDPCNDPQYTDTFTSNASLVASPEPASMALLLVAGLALGVLPRRFRKA